MEIKSDRNERRENKVKERKRGKSHRRGIGNMPNPLHGLPRHSWVDFVSSPGDSLLTQGSSPVITFRQAALTSEPLKPKSNTGKLNLGNF